MSDIRRRLKKADNKLNLNKAPITIVVTMYGGGIAPGPDNRWRERSPCGVWRTDNMQRKGRGRNGTKPNGLSYNYGKRSEINNKTSYGDTPITYSQELAEVCSCSMSGSLFSPGSILGQKNNLFPLGTTAYPDFQMLTLYSEKVKEN